MFLHQPGQTGIMFNLSVPSSVHPFFVPLLPYLWIWYFEGKWTDFGAKLPIGAWNDQFLGYSIKIFQLIETAQDWQAWRQAISHGPMDGLKVKRYLWLMNWPWAVCCCCCSSSRLSRHHRKPDVGDSSEGQRSDVDLFCHRRSSTNHQLAQELHATRHSRPEDLCSSIRYCCIPVHLYFILDRLKYDTILCI